MIKEIQKLEKALVKFARAQEKQNPGRGLPSAFSFVVGRFQQKGFTLDNQITLLNEAKDYFSKKQIAVNFSEKASEDPPLSSGL